MWSNKAPTEPGYYWLKEKNESQTVVLGERDSPKQKELQFYFVAEEFGTEGDRIIQAGGRFWSERILPPETPGTELSESLQ
ncbi:hypothetical protein [Edaphobacter sp. 12200R-103]|jgi:hypothetical protein|uniref:hypothetical protein n=1 Tax=Edaphobacter sp. 12200R-103 TaxID=2703788 RepID=UPI00138BB0EA|nr:hypothetical protein [Edaphobacter sp. 12200R-103]QHS50420.1 hypothetical protein GWR55_00620 [Edaphobacter sp. 12200R-103]